MTFDGKYLPWQHYFSDVYGFSKQIIGQKTIIQ